MKITREIQPAITEEVEITFPFYRKQQDLFYYYGISESLVICVAASYKNQIVEIQKQTLVVGNVFHASSVEITKEEFDEKFDEALHILTNFKNK